MPHESRGLHGVLVSHRLFADRNGKHLWHIASYRLGTGVLFGSGLVIAQGAVDKVSLKWYLP